MRLASVSPKIWRILERVALGNLTDKAKTLTSNQNSPSVLAGLETYICANSYLADGGRDKILMSKRRQLGIQLGKAKCLLVKRVTRDERSSAALSTRDRFCPFCHAVRLILI